MRKSFKRIFSLLLCAAMVIAPLPVGELRAYAAGGTYAVTYDGSGAAGGSVPSDSGAYAQGDPVTVQGNTGALVRPGFAFGGWITGNTLYQPGDAFSMGAGRAVLSAAWIPVYTVTYDQGSDGPDAPPVDEKRYPEGAVVTVLSDEGRMTGDGFGFKCWNTSANGGGMDYTPGETFIMGAGNVTLYPKYKTQWYLPIFTYGVTYDPNGADSGAAPNSVTRLDPWYVSVSGNTGSLLKSGFVFAGWNTAANGSGTTYQAGDMVYCDGVVTLPRGVINPSDISLSTSISVSVKKASGSDGGGDSGGGSGTAVIIQPEKRPGQPVMAGFSATPTVDSSGHAAAAISQQAVTDAMTKALAVAKARGKTTNGIGISANIGLPNRVKSLVIVLPRPTLDSLVDAEVKLFEISSSIMSFELNLEVLKEIQRQSTGDVTITVKPMQNLSAEAKKPIGTRPVYDVTVSYVRDGRILAVSSLSNAAATLSIPYTPGGNEAIGCLFGVYVDDEGNASRIPGSVFDVSSGCLILSTNRFSVYGVGYEAPAGKYTDIVSHWARESIDYVVGRGLFSGTGEKTFSPNMAMDRGVLVTVLGRLAGADVSAYKQSSFSDVAAGKYYLPYVEWAYKNGIISGTGGGKFAPEKAVTREEIALILQNYAKATGYTLPVTREAITFADNSSIGSSYTAAVGAMQQSGIMMGGSGNRFNPKSGAARAEVAAMLHRYVKLTIDPATAQGWALNDAGQWLCYKDGKVLTGTQTIDGMKYFFETTGILKTGWVKDGDSWRYYFGNKMLVGWWEIGGDAAKKTYYFTKDGLMVPDKRFQIDGCEVDANGVRKSK